MRRGPLRRILLIVDYCHTGESLHAARYLRAVREHHPNAHITLLANIGTRDALASLKVFDRIVVSHLYYERPLRSLGARVGKAWELSRLLVRLGSGYDLVICFYWGTALLRLLGFMVGRERAGHTAKTTRLLTIQLPEFQRFGRSYAEQHRELLGAVGISIPEIAAPMIADTTKDEIAVDRLLSSRGIYVSDPIAILHPGSDWACQQWIPERWASLADALHHKHGLRLVFTGTTPEARYVEEIRQVMQTPSASLAGDTSLSEIAALLRRSRLCVTVDSAIYDLAQAVGAATIVLAGPTRPQAAVNPRMAPIVVNRTTASRADEINRCRGLHFIDGGCLNYSCPFAGLREIGVDEVLAAADRLLCVEIGHTIERSALHGASSG
jgi:lipopolysaccharide heptosyltransferase I